MNSENNDSLEPNPKIKLMFDLLSRERKDELNKLLSDTVNKLKDSGKLDLGTIYPFELTKAFDQEEPKQFVYIKCAFKVEEISYNDFMAKMRAMGNTVDLVDENKPITTIKMTFEDIDIFKEENLYNWIDHVNRINKQSTDKQNLFYENNIFTKEQEGKNKDQTKVNKSANLNKSTIKKMEMMDNVMNSIKSDEDSDTELTNDELFDFYYPDAEKLTSEEYFSIFKSYAKTSLNSSMEGFINKGTWDVDNMFFNVLQALKVLQSRFSNCDFWKLDREHLAEMGFINFNDTMLLIPFWAFPVILKNSVGKVLINKNGNKVTITEYINLGSLNMINSYGCTIYGIAIDELTK